MNGKVQVFNHVIIVLVGKPDMFKPNFSLKRVRSEEEPVSWWGTQTA
jgi:hypothetical protein